MSGSRDKKARERHYRDYQGRPDVIAKRSQMNKARQAMIKAGKAAVGDGKDVHHVKPINKGGTNATANLKVVPRSSNRGYKRDANNRPVGPLGKD